jgi:hypothetical protein
MTTTNACPEFVAKPVSEGTSYDVFEVGARYEAIKRREVARRDRETQVSHVLPSGWNELSCSMRRR